MLLNGRFCCLGLHFSTYVTASNSTRGSRSSACSEEHTAVITVKETQYFSFVSSVFFFLVTPLIGIIETDLGRRDRSAPPFMDMFTLGERARFFIK